MGALLVTIAGPQRRRQLSLPDDRPIRDLLPALVDLMGEGGSDGAAWTLGSDQGDPFPGARSLADCGVRNGAILVLDRTVAWPAPPKAPTPVTPGRPRPFADVTPQVTRKPPLERGPAPALPPSPPAYRPPAPRPAGPPAHRPAAAAPPPHAPPVRHSGRPGPPGGGNDLSAPSRAAAASTTPSRAAADAGAPRSRSRAGLPESRSPFLVAAVVVGLVALGVGGWALTHRGDQTRTQASAEPAKPSVRIPVMFDAPGTADDAVGGNATISIQVGNFTRTPTGATAAAQNYLWALGGAKDRSTLVETFAAPGRSGDLARWVEANSDPLTTQINMGFTTVAQTPDPFDDREPVIRVTLVNRSFDVRLRWVEGRSSPDWKLWSIQQASSGGLPPQTPAAPASNPS